MYKISEQQIDFILNDISARGVRTEDLQYNLLDHICCIIEQNLKEDGDFENFYHNTITTFYKHELSEIEEETQLLLTFKNYYTMRKVMLNSGVFAAAILTFGIIFKFMHWPGAGILILLGLFTASLIFIPLYFTIKVKDKKKTSEKVLLAIGSIAGILGIFHILFKVFHWPGAMILGYSANAMLVLIFLPIFIILGIKNEDTKANTIVTSIIIIMGCGLWFTLVISPKASRMMLLRNTSSYLRNEQLLKSELDILNGFSDSINNFDKATETRIFNLCEELKAEMITGEIGQSIIPTDFESKNILMEDVFVEKYLADAESMGKLNELNKLIGEYNQQSKGAMMTIPIEFTIFDELGYIRNEKLYNTLNELNQIQMFVLQNKHKLMASK